MYAAGNVETLTATGEWGGSYVTDVDILNAL